MNKVAAGDSTAYSRMKAVGTLLRGHVHCYQMAIGPLTEQTNSKQPTPWGPSKMPGGSSGGSAAAVAARFTTASFGPRPPG
ncbi:amidase family protein [Nocardia iowensis]|uniref:amidase n=1 Tax=Nocardia iowensis TaxID=204891 RepID=A0ABX8RKX5_NOCIO|nr:amidase family protein [Nocardia iowensis]QXN90292.1 hypothetical protein KV110_33520 [Nocardia iowensis]